MNLHEQHTQLVARLAKPNEEIKATLTDEQLAVIKDIAHLQKGISSLIIDMFDKISGYKNMYHHFHMVVGVSGELGELLDAIKKHIIYGKDLDRENVVEELGDIFFYVRGMNGFGGLETYFDDFINESIEIYNILNFVHVTVDECLEYNINKLNKRYPSGAYSNEQAQLRADKSE